MQKGRSQPIVASEKGYTITMAVCPECDCGLLLNGSSYTDFECTNGCDYPLDFETETVMAVREIIES